MIPSLFYLKQKAFKSLILFDNFMSVLRIAHEKTGLGAVVLIDEYDKPLLDVLDTGLKTIDSEGNERLLEQSFQHFERIEQENPK